MSVLYHNYVWVDVGKKLLLKLHASTKKSVQTIAKTIADANLALDTCSYFLLVNLPQLVESSLHEH